MALSSLRSLPAQKPGAAPVRMMAPTSGSRPSAASRVRIVATSASPSASLSGPSHAEEVSRGLPATVVVASEDGELARWIQRRFNTERFRVYTNLDVIGVAEHF